MAQVLNGYQMIRADGLRLYTQVAGKGRPVILLHGFPENAHSWRHQIPALASAGFSVWAPNLRGYPPSDVSAQRRDYNLNKLVNDVAAVVSATGHQRATIVGHDWGGIIAWAFAGAYPAMLDKLVILNAPHMQVYMEKVWRTSQFLRSTYVGFFQLPYLPEKLLSAGNFSLVRQMFKTLPACRDAFSDADIAQYVESLSQPGALKAAVDYYRENMMSDGMDLARSARTEVPSLVIWGERDPALGLFLLDGVARFAPRVRIHRIPRAGHWVQNEAPDEVNRALLAFLGVSV
ncbi:alpha/beta fold hydrolase [Herbaspirillum sp. GCM10030257]|uniref:alpha/beta fold hydrolase n=1 Tax=Herbaspirillum sp. GCM10030257 TaxID=3273393 RepID=UPI00360FF6E1